MKSRLHKIMKKNGVTVEELVAYLIDNIYNTGNAILSKKGFIYIFNNVSDENILKMNGRLLKAISEFCNCSTDYLLGLSDNPSPVGN